MEMVVKGREHLFIHGSAGSEAYFTDARGLYGAWHRKRRNLNLLEPLECTFVMLQTEVWAMTRFIAAVILFFESCTVAATPPPPPMS